MSPYTIGSMHTIDALCTEAGRVRGKRSHKRLARRLSKALGYTITPGELWALRGRPSDCVLHDVIVALGGLV